MATAFYCLSLTPSLLPRAWWLQGLAAGVTAAAGYAVGAVLEAARRALSRRTGTRPGPGVRRLMWPVLGALAARLAGPATGLRRLPRHAPVPAGHLLAGRLRPRRPRRRP